MHSTRRCRNGSAPIAQRLDRHARHRLQTRTRLVEAGRRLIGARGFDGVAVASITDAADVGVGSFYNCFRSKRDFLDVIIAEVTGLLDEVLARATAGLSDPAERVAACVRHVVRLAENDPTWAWFVLRACDAVPPVTARVMAPIERHVRAGIASGRFAVEDATVAMNAVGGAMLHVMRGTLLGDVGPHSGRIAAEYVLRLLGIAPVAAHVLSARRLALDNGVVRADAAAR
jgi:AcrR family transcriptional regulator